ncbi:MAG: hypothetical protein MJ092_00140 [Lachnospiraceae bacterium]|nr:hypothetical protein [Lachnospiraceae bacterium]
MNKDLIAIIVEGESYEKGIIKNIEKVFPLGRQIYEVFTLPAGQNIYMLWKKMKEDEFETDIIEVLRDSCKSLERELSPFTRDSFSEVYLFFDYDAHQQNLESGIDADEVLVEMLESFDNETENGKLYISYPMAEAIRDFIPETCKAFSGDCFINFQVTGYKRKSTYKEDGTASKTQAISKYNHDVWVNVLTCFVERLNCLRNDEQRLSMIECKKYTPIDVFRLQQSVILSEECLMILSAFPEFIIDYFKEEYLSNFINTREIDLIKCDKNDK